MKSDLDNWAVVGGPDSLSASSATPRETLPLANVSSGCLRRTYRAGGHWGGFAPHRDMVSVSSPSAVSASPRRMGTRSASLTAFWAGRSGIRVAGFGTGCVALLRKHRYGRDPVSGSGLRRPGDSGPFFPGAPRVRMGQSPSGCYLSPLNFLTRRSGEEQALYPQITDWGKG